MPNQTRALQPNALESRLARIGDLCDLQNGHGFGASDWANAGLPIIRIQNLNGSREFNYFLGEPDSRWVVRPGDILFAWAGTRGVSFGAFRWDGPVGVLNQHIFKVTPKEGITASWLYPAMRLVTERIEKKAHGFKSTLLHVKKGDIVNQTIYFPHKEEQLWIAEELTAAEKAASLASKRLHLAVRRRKALMQQLLTGNRRFPGFTKPWSTTPIGDHFKKSQVAVEWDDTAEYSLLSVRRRCGGVFLRQKSLGRDILVKKTFRVSTGDILVSIKQVAHGAIAIVTPEFDGCHVSDSYVVFRPKDHGRISADFLSWMMKTPRFLHLATKSSHGVHIEKMFFDPVYFHRQQISFPADLEEQRRITETLQAADAEIILLERLLAAYERQKRGLMQQLLTGKRRVRVPATVGDHG